MALLSPATVLASPPCTILGTPGDDVLEAVNPNGDVVCGFEGDDILISGPGNDVLDGGLGQDTASFTNSSAGVSADLRARTALGHGSDQLVADERLQGSPEGADLLLGDGGPNQLDGQGGVDTLKGGEGADLLLGGPDPDTLVGGAGIDDLRGGEGRDSCFAGERPALKLDCEVRAFATSKGITLFAPSRRPKGFGFHEALFGTARYLRPQGRRARNDNPRLRGRPRRTDGHRYVVMASRGRAKGPTTAIDIAAPRRVRSPVNGTVEWIHRYRLYCRQWDWAIAIRPRERPEMRVLLLHLKTPTVSKGQKVIASVTPLGRLARNDAPTAQENQYFPDRYPHVHIEVERRNSPTPPCSA